MIRKQFLLALLAAAGTVFVLYLILSAGHDVPLDPVEEAPRPEVRAEPGTLHRTLSGLFAPRAETGNELRRRRNDLARQHAEALAAWRAGHKPLREVEGLEMELWVARHAVGEIDGAEMHLRLAELIERECARLDLLHEAMLASEDQVQRARLYLARQRHFAGLPTEDAEGRDYEARRKAYLEAVKERHRRLIDQGVGHREDLKQEYELLEREFPPTAAGAP